jgi:hypothetical protein
MFVTNFATSAQKITTVLEMGVNFVNKIGLGKVAIFFATKLHPTIAAIEMVEEPVFQTGLTMIVPHFAIKMQRIITVLRMETKFAFATGLEMRARGFVMKIPHGTDVYLTVRSRVFPRGMVPNVQFTVTTPREKLTVVMVLDEKYV